MKYGVCTTCGCDGRMPCGRCRDGRCAHCDAKGMKGFFRRTAAILVATVAIALAAGCSTAGTPILGTTTVVWLGDDV